MPRTAWLTVAFVLALLGAPSSAAAVNKVWDGGGPTDSWNTGANWSGDTVPAPGDTVYTGGSNEGLVITLNGTPATIAQITGGAKLVIDGTSLSITGTLDASGLDAADVVNGGAIAVTGTTKLLLGTVTLSGGLMTVSAPTTLSGTITEAGGAGSFTITPTGSVDVEPTPGLSIRAKIENDGALQTAGLTALFPSAASPSSEGNFVTTATGTLSLQPASTFTLAGNVTGTGRVEVAQSTVTVPAGGPFTPGSLGIFGAGRLDLNRNAQVGAFDVHDSTTTGGRHGSGLLTVSGPGDSALVGGQLGGTGTTVFDGPLLLAVQSDSSRLTGGAQVRTNGATDLKAGGLAIDAGSAWENAGAMTISNASPTTTALSGPGVLRNLASGVITKTAAGTFLGSGSLENAGTITVGGGIFGTVVAGAFGTLTQTAGLTTVAAGATLDKSVLLQGGTLRGAGGVRSIVNTGGTVEPGASPGRLTVAGNYDQRAGGKLRMEIAGTTPGSTYDVLAVGGAASLGGTLELASSGFVPAQGDVFRILTAGSRSGEWAALTSAQGYAANYQADGVTLCVRGSTGCAAVLPSPGPPPPPPPPGPTPTPITAKDVVSLPSNRGCVGRRLRIRLRTPTGVALKSATVAVNGHRIKVLRGRGLRKPLDLRSLPRGRFKVGVTVKLADGRRLSATRRYRRCR